MRKKWDRPTTARKLAPRLSHEARDNPMLHADTLGGVLEQDSRVCHLESRSIRQRSFEDAWASFSVYQQPISPTQGATTGASFVRCPSIATPNSELASKSS